MKINIKNNSINPHLFMTKAGYHAHYNDSYIMRLGRSDYPRFHVYFKSDKNKNLVLNLHLDQSKAVHKWGSRAHAGEYNSDVVRQEKERLERWIEYYAN